MSSEGERLHAAHKIAAAEAAAGFGLRYCRMTPSCILVDGHDGECDLSARIEPADGPEPEEETPLVLPGGVVPHDVVARYGARKGWPPEPPEFRYPSSVDSGGEATTVLEVAGNTENLRLEALKAATLVVLPGKGADVETLKVAETFLRWLEGGEES